ncbi:hypothetical protein U0070_000738 [Myodes glareolus]|uniref:Uncharacterized protein n=1 Tax=Myodes glareolus TaxID=447135 RepID=A0AAW0J5W6_MYOGA
MDRTAEGECGRLGKRLKKTRKYDIITTPAERVEMAPLNEEDDEDEDATVFDIKYRCGQGTEASLRAVSGKVLRACQHPGGRWSTAAWDMKVWAPALT